MRLALLACYLVVEARCTAGEEAHYIVVAGEDTVVVDTIAVEDHSELGTAVHIAVDTVFQYPVDPADSKSRQHRHAEVERRIFCLSIDSSIFRCREMMQRKEAATLR